MSKTNNLPDDLNLLPALQVLLEEKSLTRAASCLGLSQPAMSHKLRALRDHFEDPLLVRDKRGMKLTARAEQIQHPLMEALASLAASVSDPAPFAPKRAHRRFRFAAGDYAELVMMPYLLSELSDAAPNIELDVAPTSRRSDRPAGARRS